MDLIPSQEERLALTEAVAELLSTHGHADFLQGPLLTPSPEHFPDDWRPDLDGVTAMLKRLLAYTRMGDAPVEVVAFASPQYSGAVPVPSAGGMGWSSHHEGAAAWFAGRRDGTLLFGIDQRQLTEPERLAGVLVHEVAHAWRLLHGLVVEDRNREEQLTDVTSVYLGGGILTANNTLRNRSSGEVRGHVAVYRVSSESLGYLSPAAMSFLLALQVHARDYDGRQVRAIARQLEPNQRASFHKALRTIRRERAAIDRMLGLPRRGLWPPPAPLALPPPAKLPIRRAEDAPRTPAAKHSVYRVRGYHRRIAVFTCFIATPIAVGVFESHLLWLLPAALLPLFRLWRRDSCSRCEARLTRKHVTCPGCGGNVVGVIRNRRELHDAERENLHRQRDAAAVEQLVADSQLEQEALAAAKEPEE